ncbi:MAG: cytochrome c biogenesis CcdA family protein [Actinomycetaceae bacterium]|nr:cytochrome c biogenesis CcdA family protein [Actinomycetaceae bacterium]
MEISYLAAFIGGLLMLFAPCAAMLLPAFFAYAFTSRTTLLARTGVFALGVLLVLVPLGAFAGTLGAFIRENAQTVTLVAGIIVIVLGILQVFAISFPIPQWASRLMTPKDNEGDEAGAPSNIATFALGIGYAIAGVGCSGPILGAVLSFATLGGSVWSGALLMATFAIGMVVPVGLLALLWEVFNLSEKSWLRPKPVKIFGRWTTVMNVVSGIIFVVLGIILVFFGGYAGLPSVFTASQQVEVESKIIDAVSGVPGWLFFAFAAVIIAIIAVSVKERRSGDK